MKNFFFNADGRLRNGWWILIFIAFIAATRFAFGPVNRGLKQFGIPESWLEPLPFLFTLLVTWTCTRLRRESLASVGYRLNRRWLKEFAWGSLIGLGSVLAAAGMIWAAGGVKFELDPARSVSALSYGLYVFLCVALFEENLYRGFLFQRLLDGAGIWIAQVAFALLFAVGHWGNPDMQGATQVWATIELSLGAILMGLAYIRTRSLALPIGLHLGWNWTMGYVFGFGVSGYGHAGWFRPEFLGAADWISGGSFGPEASVFGIVVDLVLIGLLWKWKGSRDRPAPALESPNRQGGSVPVAQVPAVVSSPI